MGGGPRWNTAKHDERSNSFRAVKHFKCYCGNTLFFENSRCLQCGAETGYDPAGGSMVPLKSRGGLRRCRNGVEHQVCNWLVPANGATPWCAACRLNRTIPNLSQPGNLALWARLEAAKRRLIYTLFELGLTIPALVENDQAGLAFDFLRTVSFQPVTTGYLQGVITVNLEEADDALREQRRQELGEPSRTLLGHFRHEIGHYFYEQWLGVLWPDNPRSVAFRELFGDATANYGDALWWHYQQGPRPGWEGAFISAYASMHPWEDWSETWSHYLQIFDGLETCASLGLDLSGSALAIPRFPPEAGRLPQALDNGGRGDAEFLLWLGRWARLSPVLNEISASLGQPALYPFVLSVPVARKLRLVHYLVRERAAKRGSGSNWNQETFPYHT